jgi:hypothetical protein
MALGPARNAKRINSKGVAEVLQLLREQPVIEFRGTGFNTTCSVDTSKIERQIYLAAIPGAYEAEGVVKDRWGTRRNITTIFDAGDNRVICVPGYLTDIQKAWRLISQVAPGMRVACEFAQDGLMTIIIVLGPDGSPIKAEWPRRTPAHCLLIALFEYLSAAAALPKHALLPGLELSRRRLFDGGMS